MFATSAHPSLSAIPEFKGKVVDWVPVDVAAGTVTDILLAEGERYKVHNVVNPCPIPWGELVKMLQASGLVKEGGKMEVVSMKVWVERLMGLAESGVSPDDVSGLRLLQFFEGMAEEDEEEEKKFETSKTRAVSGNLRGCGGFNQGWVDGNVRVWREIGFLG